MNRLEHIEPKNFSSLPVNMERNDDNEQKEPTPLERIKEIAAEINSLIEIRSVPEYKEIFKEFSILTIQGKIIQLLKIISDDSNIHPVHDNHFFHTLRNFSVGFSILDRVKRDSASEEIKASYQKSIISINIHLSKMLKENKYLHESLETLGGYEGTLN